MGSREEEGFARSWRCSPNLSTGQRDSGLRDLRYWVVKGLTKGAHEGADSITKRHRAEYRSADQEAKHMARL